MTRKQMADEVKGWLGLQDIAILDETQAVYDKLYQGTIDLLARTRCTARCLHLHTTAGKTDYTLDHMVLALIDVEDGSRKRARRDQIGNSQAQFIMIRSDLIRIAPPPSDGVLDCWAVLRPTQMAGDTDSPGMEAYGGIPDEYHDAIVTYALWKLADYADDGGSQQGERYRLLYEGQDGRGGRLMEIRRLVNKRGTARAPARRVGLSPVPTHDAYVG